MKGTVSLTQGVRRAVQIRGEDVAVIDGPVRFSWREVGARIAKTARAFVSNGLTPGGRVALLALNSHKTLDCFYGTPHGGGVIVPLNHRLSPDELVSQVRDCAPDLIVLGTEFVERAEALQHACSESIRSLFVTGPHAGSGDLLSLEEAMSRASPLPDAGRAGDDLACLFYTGGTTRSAKGVMLSHANLVANTANTVSMLELYDTSVNLHHGPLFHLGSGARLFSVTSVGGTHVFLPRFSTATLLSELARSRVTHATLVLTMLRMLLDDPSISSADLSSLRYITYGAAPISEALLREAMAALPEVRFVQSYGMTELSPVATLLAWRDHDPKYWPRGRLRSAGRAVMLVDLAVKDPDGAFVPNGTTGEIVVRGPNVMLGYWNQPELTAATIRDGWVHTGDVGYLDDAGYLFVVDRLKDVIISGGENVYSLEVEDALAAHPAVSQCAVLGQPHPQWCEAVHAVVTLRPGCSATPEALIDHCRARITHYKGPRTVEIRSQPLPLSSANKILKSKLRDELLEPGQGAAPLPNRPSL